MQILGATPFEPDSASQECPPSTCNSVVKIYDRQHSLDEDRFIAIGPVKRGLICLVCVERIEDRIRLISARFATPQESRLFVEYLEGRLP